MENFIFHTPTKVVFGKDAEKKVGSLVKKTGCTKVLVHYGSGSVEKSGLLGRVTDALTEAKVGFVTLGGVVPNPRLSKVREGLALCKAEKVDFILAVGGGSTIDSAKAIAYGLANPNHDVWDFFAGKAEAEGMAPVGCILTLAAAGSEMSNSCVITNDDGGIKRGYGSADGTCTFAIMNPELTTTLPPYQTACGVVDILMHTMERYFVREKDTDITDRLAEAVLKNVMQYGRKALEDPKDYNARAQIMWSGSLAHNGLTGCGSTGDWATHDLEHELSGLYDVAHGAGLAALWGSWARYVMHTDLDRFAQFAVNVMGAVNHFGDAKRTALAGIVAMEEYFNTLNMPTSLTALGVAATDEDLRLMAEKCAENGTRIIGNFRPLGQEDMLKIYTLAK